MKKIYNILLQNPLFKGFTENDYEKIMNCLIITSNFYKKDDIIIHIGSPVTSVGLVVSGSVKIIREDINGDINILSEILSGDMFAEALVCSRTQNSPVSVISSAASEIIFINYNKILNECDQMCSFRGKLIENMLYIIAKKNLFLNQKIEIMSKRSIREKLLCFLEIQKNKFNSNQFTISYNREELSNFLAVDRSSLSRELGNMRDERIIDFDKNTFEIL